MKDYTKLFEIEKKKDNIKEGLNHLEQVDKTLTFYDEWYSKEVATIRSKLLKLLETLNKEFDEEKQNFTPEELKELHWIYKKSTK